MAGKVIVFLIILVIIIIVLTAIDINNLRRGIGGYIQNPPGMLVSTVCLMAVPVVLGLKQSVVLWVAIVLDVIYVAFYTWTYFKIKEEK